MLEAYDLNMTVEDVWGSELAGSLDNDNGGVSTTGSRLWIPHSVCLPSSCSQSLLGHVPLVHKRLPKLSELSLTSYVSEHIASGESQADDTRGSTFWLVALIAGGELPVLGRPSRLGRDD